MLPSMQANSERMVSIFMAIEQLEHIVSEARTHVNAVEAEVAAAEREKSMLTSVFRSVKSSFFSVRWGGWLRGWLAARLQKWLALSKPHRCDPSDLLPPPRAAQAKGGQRGADQSHVEAASALPRARLLSQQHRT